MNTAPKKEHNTNSKKEFIIDKNHHKVAHFFLGGGDHKKRIYVQYFFVFGEGASIIHSNKQKTLKRGDATIATS